jgi:uncharacterized protein
MILEWLRRNNTTFGKHLKTYLFTTQPILDIEEEDTAGEASASAPDAGVSPTSRPSLTIGTMKGE